MAESVDFSAQLRAAGGTVHWDSFELASDGAADLATLARAEMWGEDILWAEFSNQLGLDIGWYGGGCRVVVTDAQAPEWTVLWEASPATDLASLQAAVEDALRFIAAYRHQRRSSWSTPTPSPRKETVMPAVLPLSTDIVDEIDQALPLGYDLIKVAPDAAPEQVLKAVETLLDDYRERGDDLDRGALVALGVVVGDQYVRHLGWSWVQLQYEDDAAGEGPVAVVNDRQDIGNQPMNWVYEIATDPDHEIGILLSFNMVRAGTAQGGQPGDPVMFH